jgi:glycerol-3-phosphate O-acyltransferase / dihydroxyacetone phosphate acyltransferase
MYIGGSRYDHRMIGGLLAAASRLLLGVFYRRVDVVGLAHVPRSGPLLIVANHQNALVDPMLLLGTLPRALRPVAKAPLFANPVLGPLLRAVGAVPVHRRQESAGSPDRNDEAFARVTALFAAGEAVLLFPEGVSQPEPVLMPLRTGAARLLLGAEHARGGALGITLLPVGLVYEEPGSFRTGRALVVTGEPVPTRDLVDGYAADPTAAVRALTDRIAGALRGLIIEAEDRHTLHLVGAVERLWGARAENDAVARAAWTRRALTAYAILRREAPARVASFRRALEQYEKDRELAGVDDPVYARYPIDRVVRYAAREGSSLLVGAPLALWGLCVHALPYRLTGFVLRLLSPEADMIATNKLAVGTLLYPLCWAIEAWTVARIAGGLAVLAFLLLLVPAGFFALTWHARLVHFRAQALGFFAFLFRPDLHRRLRARRHALQAELDALARMVPVGVETRP